MNWHKFWMTIFQESRLWSHNCTLSKFEKCCFYFVKNCNVNASYDVKLTHLNSFCSQHTFYLESYEKDSRNDGKSASLCYEFNRKYSQSVSLVVFNFSTLLHLDLARESKLPAFFFFFISPADILQLLDKYSSWGPTGSVRGQQQTPHHNAEHLSLPPTGAALHRECPDASLRFIQSWAVGIFSTDLLLLRCKRKQIMSWRCFAAIEALPLKTFPSGERGNIWRQAFAG